MCRIKMPLSCLSLSLVYSFVFGPHLFVFSHESAIALRAEATHTHTHTRSLSNIDNGSLTGLFPLSPSHLLYMKGNSLKVPTHPTHVWGWIVGGGGSTHRQTRISVWLHIMSLYQWKLKTVVFPKSWNGKSLLSDS